MEKEISTSFNEYFNVTLNLYYHKFLREKFIIRISTKGSIYNIIINSYEKSGIMNYISSKLDDFKKVIIHQLKNIFAVTSNRSFLEDSLNISVQTFNTTISFYICIGNVCPSNMNTVTKRAGIIPYFTLYGTEYLMLGVKTYVEGNVWSDFGGGCKTSKNELAYDCANRELLEESLGLIQPGGTITHILSNKVTGSVWDPKLKKYRPGYTLDQLLYFIDYTSQLITKDTDEMILVDITEKYKNLIRGKQNPELESIFIVKYDSFRLIPDELLGENLRGIKNILPNKLSE